MHYEENRESILEERSKNRDEIPVQNHEYYVLHRDERRRLYAENRHVVNNCVRNKNVRIVERHAKSDVMGLPNFVSPIAHNLSSLNIECQHCKAVFFKDELKKSCCHNGKLSHLSIQSDFDNFLIALGNFFVGTDEKSRNFREFIRQYNNANAIASMGAKVEEIPGHGPYCSL